MHSRAVACMIGVTHRTVVTAPQRSEKALARPRRHQNGFTESLFKARQRRLWPARQCYSGGQDILPVVYAIVRLSAVMFRSGEPSMQL
jgi:hypothetical protein